MAKLKSVNGKSLKTNNIAVQSSNGSINYRDLLSLSVFDTEDSLKEYKIVDLLESSVEVKKTYRETRYTVSLLVSEIDAYSNEMKSLKESLLKYIKNLEEINVQQSTVIDRLSKKIDILVERIKVLEDKTEML